jgi:hypothetical protein
MAEKTKDKKRETRSHQLNRKGKNSFEKCNKRRRISPRQQQTREKEREGKKNPTYPPATDRELAAASWFHLTNTGGTNHPEREGRS